MREAPADGNGPLSCKALQAACDYSTPEPIHLLLFVSTMYANPKLLSTILRHDTSVAAMYDKWLHIVGVRKCRALQTLRDTTVPLGALASQVLRTTPLLHQYYNAHGTCNHCQLGWLIAGWECRHCNRILLPSSALGTPRPILNGTWFPKANVPHAGTGDEETFWGAGWGDVTQAAHMTPPTHLSRAREFFRLPSSTGHTPGESSGSGGHATAL